MALSTGTVHACTGLYEWQKYHLKYPVYDAASLDLLHRIMPVNSEQREQFYLESGQLRLRNIYAKWQVSVTSNVEVSVTS